METRLWASYEHLELRITDFESWLKYGFSRVVYFKPDQSGQVVEPVELDPSSIKPLVNAQGIQPEPPFPAWQQYVYGIPAGQFCLGEIGFELNIPRSERKVNENASISELAELVQRSLEAKPRQRDIAYTGNIDIKLEVVGDADAAELLQRTVRMERLLTSCVTDEKTVESLREAFKASMGRLL